MPLEATSEVIDLPGHVVTNLARSEMLLALAPAREVNEVVLRRAAMVRTVEAEEGVVGEVVVEEVAEESQRQHEMLRS